MTTISLASGAQAQGGFPPPELATTKVRDNVYMIRSGASGNVTVLVADEGVVLIDDKFATDHDGVMAELRELADKAVLYVINRRVRARRLLLGPRPHGQRHRRPPAAAARR